ncbi:hypothetical protein [Paracoccus versutus]|uniref:hypothetical protein n=1 Tax=Paracoccus versutus TaxID=34007 RepID=UPI000DF8576C|nr:hypothetical protein [Paracoccus versutus]RDD72937.1 hypothetical protein DVR11_03145 [Paracoccus versutus]
MSIPSDFSVKAGQIVKFSSGAYGNYRCIDTFVAIENVTHDEMVALAQSANEAGGELDDRQRLFLSRLIRTGRFLELKAREIHMGSYDEIELDNYQ